MDSARTSKRRRILVIDDNRSIHEDLRKILSSGQKATSALDDVEAELFGQSKIKKDFVEFEIESAYQGQEGLTLVRQAVDQGCPYAMAFVDVRMPPGMDGIETTTRLWEIDPDLQIVICTAYSDHSWDEMLEKLGTSDRLLILKKPFDNIEALQLANALTEKWHLSQQARHQMEELELRVQARTQDLRAANENLQREVLERNRAEEDLSAISSILIAVDGNNIVTEWNHAAERLLGVKEADAVGRPLRDCQVQWDSDLLLERIAEARGKDHQMQLNDLGFKSPEGKQKVLGISINPFKSDQEKRSRCLLLGADITEQRLLEFQLRQAQKLESIGQLAAGIAHEINTPTQFVGDNTRFLQDSFGVLDKMLKKYEQLLKSIGTGTVQPELIAEIEALAIDSDLDFLSKEIPRAIEQTLEGIERVSKIVQAMKIYAHPGSAEKTAVDLNKAIESTLTVARNEWKYVADVEADYDPNLPPVPCLVGDMNQVILNMIINAAHAISDVLDGKPGNKGTITVSTRQVEDWAEIRISDTGSGIPEAVRPRIFDPFFTTKAVGKGTGQGLAISHAVIVEKHRGSIAFETELGLGTTFIIRLPLVEFIPNDKSQTSLQQGDSGMKS